MDKIMIYTEKKDSCSACGYNKTLEHRLFHKTGLPESIIKKLNVTSIDQIIEAFKNSKQISPCYIDLNGRRTKFKEQNRYLFPKELIDLININ